MMNKSKVLALFADSVLPTALKFMKNVFFMVVFFETAFLVGYNFLRFFIDFTVGYAGLLN